MSSPRTNPDSDSGRSRNQIAGSSGSVNLAHAVAGVDVLEPLVDRVEHHEHRLDGRVVAPEEQVPGLIRDPRPTALPRRLAADARRGARRTSVRSAGWRRRSASSRAPRRGGPEREARYQCKQEQRGQALLAVERPQRSVVDLAVDEVQPDAASARRRRLRCERTSRKSVRIRRTASLSRPWA